MTHLGQSLSLWISFKGLGCWTLKMVSWTLPSPLSLVALPTPPPPALSTSLQESFLGSEALCLTWRQLSALKGEADCWQGVKTKQNLYEKDKTESFRPSGNKFCFYTWGGRAKTIIQKLCNRKEQAWDFPGGPVVENLLARAGDMDSIPGPERVHIVWCI